MKAPTLKFWLVAILVLTLTQPEALFFSRLGESYSLYRDLSICMAFAGAGLTIVSAYGLYLWRRGKLALLHPVAVFLLAVGAFCLGYWAYGREMGYGVVGMIKFITGSFIVFFITPLLQLTGFYDLYRSYDRPLLIAWIIMVAITLALTVLYLRARRKVTEPRSPGP